MSNDGICNTSRENQVEAEVKVKEVLNLNLNLILWFYDLDPFGNLEVEFAAVETLIDPDTAIVDTGLIAPGIVDYRGQDREDILHRAIPQETLHGRCRHCQLQFCQHGRRALGNQFQLIVAVLIPCFPGKGYVEVAGNMPEPGQV
jgi:hypothetical protein